MRAESNQQIRLNLAVRKEFDKAPNIIESLNLRVTPSKLAHPLRVLLKRTMWTCSPVIGTAVMRSPQAFDSSVTKTGVFPRCFMGQVDRAFAAASQLNAILGYCVWNRLLKKKSLTLTSGSGGHWSSLACCIIFFISMKTSSKCMSLALV